MMFDLHTLCLLLIFIAAGLVKGVTGMGLPTVAMGLLGLLMPPPAAAAKLLMNLRRASDAGEASLVWLALFLVGLTVRCSDTPVNYFVIPAKAGIQKNLRTGPRLSPG